MAYVEPISTQEIADALTAAFGDRIGWQVDASELDARMDDAAHTAAAILNRPYFESDLSDDEIATAGRELSDAMARQS